MDLTLVTVTTETLGDQLGGRVRCACGWQMSQFGITAWVLADVVRVVAEHPHPIGGGVGGALEGGAPRTTGAPVCSHGYAVGVRGQHIATNGACSDHDQNRSDRAENRGESGENRGEMIGERR